MINLDFLGHLQDAVLIQLTLQLSRTRGLEGVSC
jgi:hypothetical protein